MLKNKPVVHFIGIGGIGMSALARWFLAQGWSVSGSDLEKSKTTDELKKEKVLIKIGHRPKNVPQNSIFVVYNQAVEHENPELRRARALKIPLLSYPEAIGNLTKHYKTITVSGAHGKSTTTALLSTIFIQAKLDPTIIIGTKLKELKGKNFRLGRSEYLILEADEWKAAFLHYSPFLAIITNIDREHLDFYKNLATIKKTFLKFLGGVQNNGILVLNRDNEHLLPLKSKIEQIAKKKDVRVYWYSLRQPQAKKVKQVLRIPGIHNVSNGLAALTAAKAIGIPEKKALNALGHYKGAWRRLEYRGDYKLPRSRASSLRGKQTTSYKLPVYDDYGHHPTEIAATLQALREKYPKKTLVCVFQPHQAERLKLLFKEFQSAFDRADISLILPIYQVAGRDEKPNPRFDSQALVKTIQKNQPRKRVFYLAEPKNLKKAIDVLLKSAPAMSLSNGKSAVIVIMGAGNIVQFTDSLLK